MLKRAFDIIVSLTTLILFSPILLFTGLFVAVKLGRPVIFKQKRPGKNGKPFMMNKFRTMTNARDDNGQLLPNKERMTGFGMKLRSTSLDELPELWNVLKGDMSLVGPRPLRMHYIPLYSEYQNRRHEVKPGITGWAQINGRNAVTWDERFEMDVWYVDHQTFWLDLKILFLTILKVVNRDDIAHEGDVSMPPFEGNGEHNVARHG
jgi:lipopolysaccharide/colanic/teichoic acid biosynthesis glycosyltransferase